MLSSFLFVHVLSVLVAVVMYSHVDGANAGDFLQSGSIGKMKGKERHKNAAHADASGSTSTSLRGGRGVQQQQRKLATALDVESTMDRLSSYGETMLLNIMEEQATGFIPNESTGYFIIPDDDAYKNYIYIVVDAEYETSALVQYKLVRDENDNDRIIGLDDTYAPIWLSR